MALLSNSWTIDLGVILLAVFGVAYTFFTRNYRKWEKKGIPFLKPLPFVGNFKDTVLAKKNIGQVIQDAYEKGKGKPFIGVFAFDQPMLVIRDLDVVKSVLVKDFNYFMDRNFSVDKDSDPLLGRTLSSINGNRWRHLRMKLSPTFTSGKLKRMFEFVDECGKELVLCVNKYSDDGRIEVKETMARYTTDVIASCIFGIQGNALRDKNSEFRQMLRKIFDFDILKGIKTAVSFFAPVLIIALKLKLIEDDVSDYIRNTIWTTVEHRKKNNVVRKDFLDLLMQLRDKGFMEEGESNGPETEPGKKFELEEDDFVAQAFGFLAAGFETSSTTMSFALYELSLQPEIQNRLRQEIQSVLEKNNGQLTYDGLQEMIYLDMVVSETLRKYPVLPFLDRKVLQPYTLPGTNFTLDKGDVVIISLSGIHYDPQYYPNPQRFDPERFTEENKRSRPNYSYMPFGEGPRICIGMRMGLLQAKAGLAHLIANFEVAPCQGTPVPMEFDAKSFLLSAKGTLPLSISKIK
ncbi:cytochrome P450 6j1 [Anabrus simplex]|uniref:cytochrome P450 6j1 n=1 Tax=Anabrus simplex TaxID=316456 RepID=UPI0035A31B80